MISRWKLFLTLAVLITALSESVLASECATCKGSWKAGGGAFFVYNSGDKFLDPYSKWKNFSVSATPYLERFVANGLAVGSHLLLTHEFHGSKAYEYSQSSKGIGLTMSSYWDVNGSNRIESNLLVYMKAGLGVSKFYVSEFIPYYPAAPRLIVSTFQSYDYSTMTLSGELGFMPMFSKSIGFQLGAIVIQNILISEKISRDLYQTRTTLQIGAGFAVFAL